MPLFSFRPTSNQIAPDIIAKLKAASNARPAMQAAGLAVETSAKRAVREPSLRTLDLERLFLKTGEERQGR